MDDYFCCFVVGMSSCNGYVVCVACDGWLVGSGMSDRYGLNREGDSTPPNGKPVLENVCFGVLTIVRCVTLSSMCIIAYELFESICYGGVIDDFIDNGDDIDSVKSL